MTAPSQNRPPRNSQRQRGAAMIIMMLIVMLGLIALFTLRMDRKRPELDADRKTALALAQAKEALLGRAASNDDPGTLSCPDIDDNGTADTEASGECKLVGGVPQYSGRFPWKTLELGDVFDGSGARLWYVVSANFRDMGTSLTTLTPGTISVNGGPPSTIVAVIIAPGPPVAGQSRSLANKNIITNYLESYVNDTTINTLAPSATFNDRIITITTNELFSQSTQRIARELVASLPHPYPVSADTSWYPNASWTIKKWDGWLNSSVTTYTQTDHDHANFIFSNCTSTFKITWDVLNNKSRIDRDHGC